jgi:Zn-dependent peptidase ImmA (M78 family)
VKAKVAEIHGRFCSHSSGSIDIEEIIRSLGILLFKQDFRTDLSGAAFIRGAQRIISVNTNKREPIYRQRFTMAHELGHILLHDDQEMSVDVKPITLLRNNESSSGTSWREVEANMFAANLLMPESSIRLEYDRLNSFLIDEDIILERLAKTFGVSNHAMSIRLSTLNLALA